MLIILRCELNIKMKEWSGVDNAKLFYLDIELHQAAVVFCLLFPPLA